MSNQPFQKRQKTASQKSYSESEEEGGVTFSEAIAATKSVLTEWGVEYKLTDDAATAPPPGSLPLLVSSSHFCNDEPCAKHALVTNVFLANHNGDPAAWSIPDSEVVREEWIANMGVKDLLKTCVTHGAKRSELHGMEKSELQRVVRASSATPPIQAEIGSLAMGGLFGIKSSKMKIGPEATEELEQTLKEKFEAASKLVMRTSVGSLELDPRGLKSPLERKLLHLMKLVSYNLKDETPLACLEWHATQIKDTLILTGYWSVVADPYAV